MAFIDVQDVNVTETKLMLFVRDWSSNISILIWQVLELMFEGIVDLKYL